MFIILNFLCTAPPPTHEMAEGIKSYLSVCVCLCVSESRLAHNFVLHWGFENNLVQMIIMTRQCVTYRYHVYRSRSQFTLKLSA